MKTHIRFTLAAIILCTCVVFVYIHIFAIPEKTHTPNKEFPARISGWIAEEIVYDKQVLKVLSPDKIIYKSYSNRNAAPPITLFMAYYNTLEKADLSHSPIVCFTGQGWHIERVTKQEIPINLPDTRKIKVNQIIQSKLDTTMITLFWYQSANHAFANRGIQKLSLFFNKLMGKPDNNAFVRLTLIVPAGKSVQETTTYLFTFLRDLYPELKNFFN